MKVSVIIPLYNAEKYLGVCLESLLIQTLTDYEVIVVDDCSTDSSLAIAESYVERFNGRLNIIKLEKNTGSGSVPRNVGLEHARGKYVFFVDSDDLIVNNALETLYNFAEDYQADVVYMEKFFLCNEEPVSDNLEVAVWCYSDSFEKKPTFRSNDIAECVKNFLTAKFCWASWAKFLRRDILIDNAISFPCIKLAEDIIWTFKLICTSRRWLNIPTPLYAWRKNDNSFSRRKRTPEQIIIFRTSPLIIGIDCLDEFMSRIDYFKQNPAVRLQVLNFFANIQFDWMKEALSKLDSVEVYEIFLHEFSKVGNNQPALIAYLLTLINIYRSELKK